MTASSTTKAANTDRRSPASDCGLCLRLQALREAQRAAEPEWFNAPVPSFGAPAARLLVVGLAPGLRGANRTGRPFTGDFAGEVLYPALRRHGFAQNDFAARVDDGFELVGCRVTNAVRCVPPANRPTPAEIVTCRRFLADELLLAPRPSVVLALGRIAYESSLRALGLALRDHPFGHGAQWDLPTGQTLIASFHTSRYNVNTGRLTADMFDAVVARAAALLAVDSARGAVSP